MTILETIHRLREIGVLGMNRRNAEYIMRSNPRSSFPLVDDKLKTKQLAEAHQIPTPPLFHVIEHHGDIPGLEKVLRGHQDFVIKPARGAGGSGIVLIKGHTLGGFIKQNGEVILMKDLTYHISDILSGIYSLEGLEDRAFIEGLVHPDTLFDAVTYCGVPDIRIIVYRGVPPMSMVRLPTRASDGKANLHRGAIGVGIDMAEGTTLAGVHQSGHRIDLTQVVGHERVEVDAPAAGRDARLGPVAERGSDASGFGMDALRDFGDALGAGAMRCFEQNRIAVGQQVHLAGRDADSSGRYSR